VRSAAVVAMFPAGKRFPEHRISGQSAFHEGVRGDRRTPTKLNIAKNIPTKNESSRENPSNKIYMSQQERVRRYKEVRHRLFGENQLAGKS